MNICDHTQPIHTALRAAVHGGSFTSLVRFISLQLRLYVDVPPPAKFIDDAGHQWALLSSDPVGDGFACTYERI